MIKKIIGMILVSMPLCSSVLASEAILNDLAEAYVTVGTSTNVYTFCNAKTTIVGKASKVEKNFCQMCVSKLEEILMEIKAINAKLGISPEQQYDISKSLILNFTDEETLKMLVEKKIQKFSK